MAPFEEKNGSRGTRPSWQPPRFVPGLVWNYLKVAGRKLKRQKGYSFINIAGLAVGLAACLLILVWVRDELSYDRYHEKADRIYKLAMFEEIGGVSSALAVAPFPAAPAFVTERRTKEIGIRKVLGASEAGLAALLSKEFLKWVLIANAIALPAAYWLVGRLWLRNFAYRTNPGILIFISVAGLSLLTALLTVSWQAVRAAIANPVDSLRYE
jgi:hypothetical protein